MKKFITGLFVFSLLIVITAILAVPVLTKILGPEMIADTPPPDGLPLGVRDFPIPERSMIAIRLNLPVQALTNAANQNIPKEFSGVQQNNFHKKVKQGVVNWRMWPGQLAVINTGHDLAFSLPLKGDFHSAGRFGMLKIKVQARTDMDGKISGRFRPLITPDWRVAIQGLNPQIKVQRANTLIGKGRRGPQDGTEMLQNALTPAVQKEFSNLGPTIAKAINLKPGIQKLWNQGHLIRTISEKHSAWFVLDPGLPKMGPIDYSNPEQLSITIGMVAQSFIANTEPINRHPEALPPLDLSTQNPATNLRIPIIANLSALNTSLRGQNYPLKLKYGLDVDLSDLEVHLGKPGYLNISLKADTMSNKWLENGISGRILVQGKPIINCRDQSLGLADVSLAVESKEAISGTAAWLFEDLLVKAIEKELRVDLKQHIPEIEKEIQEVITSAPVPSNISLKFERPKVKLLGAYTVKSNGWNERPSPGIVFVMGATGEIDVTINELPSERFASAQALPPQ